MVPGEKSQVNSCTRKFVLKRSLWYHSPGPWLEIFHGEVGFKWAMQILFDPGLILNCLGTKDCYSTQSRNWLHKSLSGMAHHVKKQPTKSNPLEILLFIFFLSTCTSSFRTLLVQVIWCFWDVPQFHLIILHQTLSFGIELSCYFLSCLLDGNSPCRGGNQSSIPPSFSQRKYYSSHVLQ